MTAEHGTTCLCSICTEQTVCSLCDGSGAVVYQGAGANSADLDDTGAEECPDCEGDGTLTGTDDE